MNRRFYLLKDLGILIGVISLLLLLSLSLYRLVKRSPGTAAALPLEIRLKFLIEDSIRGEETVIEIPEVSLALQTITGRLLPAAGGPDYEVDVLVIDSPVVNALAFPGGLIVVYSGLMKRLESPEEMAAVMAHELGHVVNRDAMKNLSRQLVLASLFSVFGGQEAKVLIQRIIREIVTISYSRAVEAAADDFALDLLTRAKIDPAYLGKAFERLKEEKEGDQMELFKYIDSHPDLDSRIQKANKMSQGLDIETGDFGIDWAKVKKALPSVFEP